jgi:hypothetical protein
VNRSHSYGTGLDLLCALHLQKWTQVVNPMPVRIELLLEKSFVRAVAIRTSFPISFGARSDKYFNGIE